MSRLKRTIKADLDSLKTLTDADLFLKICDTAKAQITEHLFQDEHFEAAGLARAYAYAFVGFKHVDKAFTLKVLQAFPVNCHSTLSMLGIDDEIDEFILSRKVRLHTMSEARDHAHTKLLEWAVAKQDMVLIEKVVLQISRDLLENHPGSKQQFRNASMGMVRVLVLGEQEQTFYGPVIDDAIASLVCQKADYQQPAECMPRLAAAGLSKTLMKMLEFGLLNEYRPISFDVAETQRLIESLPANPSPQQLHWIHHSIKIPDLTEKILFDESVDMDAYIEALRATEFNGRYNNLVFNTLRQFKEILTPEHLTTVPRKRRAAKLVSAVCEQEQAYKRTKPEDIRKTMTDIGFHEYVFKLSSMFKAKVLEDELGL